MRKRATVHTSWFGKAVGGLALVWALVGGSLVWARHRIERLPPVTQQRETISSCGGPIVRGSALSVLGLDAPYAADRIDLASSAVAIDPSLLDCGAGCTAAGTTDCWSWQMLPDGLIYHPYLAGAKEPRLAAQWVYEREQGWFHDVVLGGQVAIARYGTTDRLRPEGWQIDFEGAVFPRIEAGSLDVVSMDFRYGVPLSYGRGRHRSKLAFYHLSSHLADEFMLANPAAPRINYLRDALVLGHSYYPTDDLRLYAEAAYAFRVDGGAEPWEFQFGIDYSPIAPTGFRPVPFIAVNGHLREESAFGGNLVVQVGYQWRGATGNLLRIGMHYYSGKSDQYEFFNRFEDKIGLGIWYDY